MRRFAYEVRQPTGQTERGVVEGENAQAVARALQAKGYFVVALRPVRGSLTLPRPALSRNLLGPIFYPVSSKSQAIFFTSLRALISAGMNLSQVMRVLSEQTSNATLKRAARDMSQEAAQGRRISSVLEHYPSAFDPTTRAVIAAGEESGTIEQTVDRMAKYHDRIFQLQQSYRSQTFHPKILLAALILIPTAPTLVLNGLNAWLGQLLVRAGPLAAAVFVLWYGWRALKRIPAISEPIDRIRLSIPWFGSLARRMATARWARALATLTGAGVPVHRALLAAAAASGNKAMEASLVREARGLLEGRPLTEVVVASRAVPPLAVELLAPAEASGSYAEALDKVAEYYESEVEVGGKQTAVILSTGFYLVIALMIAIVVIQFWSGYFRALAGFLE